MVSNSPDTDLSRKSHRLTLYAQKALYELRDEKLSTADKNIQRRYEAYSKNNSRMRQRPSKESLKSTTWDTLPEVLSSFGSNYKEFFEKVSITKTEKRTSRFTEKNKSKILPGYFDIPAGSKFPVRWATDTLAELCRIIDRMTDEQKNTLYGICIRLLPKLTAEALKEYDDTDAYERRIVNVLARTHNDSSCCLALYDDLGIVQRWQYNRRNGIIVASTPHEYMSAISLATGISIHWMLKAGDVPVLAETGSTERVMDIICFLPAQLQEVLYHSLKFAESFGDVIFDVNEEGGAEDGFKGL